MVHKVRQFINEQKLLQAGDSVVLGVSGGADSVALLCLLCELREELRLTLTAVHINHGIRGAEADRDEQFVKELCDRVNVPLKVYHYNVPEIAAQEHLTEEEAGRAVRYQAFEEVREEFGAKAIATAHHQNDNAETILFHAFRGSGVRGLTGIPAKRGNIVRPLLCVSREEIEAYLIGKDIAWCTDSTNAQTEYSRNRIRNNILPEAEIINAGAVKHLAELSEEMAEIADYLGAEAVRLLEQARGAKVGEEQADDDLKLDIQCLQSIPTVLLREVLFLAFSEMAGSRKDIGREHIVQIAELLDKQSGRSIDLPYGVTVRREFGWLIFEKGSRVEKSKKAIRNDTDAAYDKKQMKKELSLQKSGCETDQDCLQATEIIKEFPYERFFGDYVLRLDLIPYEKNMPIPKSDYEKWYDYDKMDNALYVRSRMAGDYLVIHKDGGRKSLKSILIEQKVPAKEREKIVLLAMADRVLWAVGVRSDEGFHVTESTKHILKAEWKKKNEMHSDAE